MKIPYQYVRAFCLLFGASGIALLLWLHDPACPTWWFCASRYTDYTWWHVVCATCSTSLYALCGSTIWLLPVACSIGAYQLCCRRCISHYALGCLALGMVVMSILDAYFCLSHIRGVMAGGIVGFYGLLFFRRMAFLCSLERMLFLLTVGYSLLIVGSAWTRPLQRILFVWYRIYIVPFCSWLWFSLQRCYYAVPHRRASLKVTRVHIPSVEEVPVSSDPQSYHKISLEHILGKASAACASKTTVDYRAHIHIIEDTLRQFGIRGRVTDVIVGPVVVLYEYQPERNVPITKIRAREHDLMRALQVVSLRIIAPIPGKSVVGFECARADRDAVLFSEQWTHIHQVQAQLPFLLGVTTGGMPVVLDIATLPHLLVAGSTGSGKSAVLNSLIVSLLATTTPREVRLILIDPKRLEFTWYVDVPHLLFPIVTDTREAISVLRWVVSEMERRYQILSQAGVSQVSSYRAAGHEMADIVIVIDEWADVMMTGGKEAEISLVRLAQMSRAAGIYLVVSTQRPSVDVITGLIKVNIPARIACRVASQIDSRTIIGVPGAELLAGKGDMLVLLPSKLLERMHGAYVTPQEIQAIACAVRRQGAVSYMDRESAEERISSELSSEDALLYKQVLEVMKGSDEISISLLQRKLRIGYNRSARMIDYLEARGMILPSDGGKMRKVLRHE